MLKPDTRTESNFQDLIFVIWEIDIKIIWNCTLLGGNFSIFWILIHKGKRQNPLCARLRIFVVATNWWESILFTRSLRTLGISSYMMFMEIQITQGWKSKLENDRNAILIILNFLLQPLILFSNYIYDLSGKLNFTMMETQFFSTYEWM